MVLVYYGRDMDKKPVFDRIFRDLGIAKRDLGDADLNATVGELADGDGQSRDLSGDKPLFLYYDKLDSKEIQKVEAALKEAGLRVSRKAVRTENNKKWTLEALMYEIGREDEWFRKTNRLYQLVTHPDKARLASDPAYMALMAQSFALLEENDMSEEQLDQAIAAIETDLARQEKETVPRQ
ncbi:DUF3783 domain-containing protein [uncultured Faecalibaculum sp.]|uniref:DUF3783 domain-containing protein n=1 Tax=uncultured Faecalibaculum sp. TaxID=1729681 RepID=UPI0026291BDB|nr:DUF3783 domain-containing protein [uncultured Faecalibaculum sp.]